MIDVFTLAHILSAVILWIIFKKKWRYVIPIFIGWELIEFFILSYLHPIFQETFIDTAMDVIIESAVYFLLVACVWRMEKTKDKSGKIKIMGTICIVALIVGFTIMTLFVPNEMIKLAVIIFFCIMLVLIEIFYSLIYVDLHS